MGVCVCRKLGDPRGGASPRSQEGVHVEVGVQVCFPGTVTPESHLEQARPGPWALFFQAKRWSSF